jgi:hypothetical protein
MAGIFSPEGNRPGSLTGGAEVLTGHADWNTDTEVAPAKADDRGIPVRFEN